MSARLPLRARWCFFRAWLDAGPLRRPVPDDERCVMGGPLGYRCKRRALPSAVHPFPGLWCAKHERYARRWEQDRATSTLGGAG